MTIEELNLQITKLAPKPGEIIVVKFPMGNVQAQVLEDAHRHLSALMPPGVSCIFVPSDTDFTITKKES